MSAGPAGFVHARLAELEERANGLFFATRIPDRIPDFTAAGGPAAEEFWKAVDPVLVLAVVKAVRAIVEDTWGGPDHEDVWREHLRYLTGIWDKHPDYKPGEWWPPSNSPLDRVLAAAGPVTAAEVERACTYGWCAQGCAALDVRIAHGTVELFCPSCRLVQ